MRGATTKTGKKMRAIKPWMMLAAAVLPAGVAQLAEGQTDPSMVAKPWEDKQFIETTTDTAYVPSTSFFGKAGGGNSSMSETFATGRMRLTTEYPIGPTVGYDLKQLVMNGHGAPVPNILTDLSVAAGTPVAEIGPIGPLQRGFWGFTVGAGYAGDDPMGDGKSWYPKASVMMGGEIDKKTDFFAMLEYDGNRGIFPDMPMPGIAYHHVVNDQFEYVIGTYGYINWKPTGKLTIEINYEPIYTVDGNISYEFIKHFFAFTAYHMRELPFHTEEMAKDRRLFFDDQEAEVGLRWAPNKTMDVTLAGGYAFQRQFATGWDDRTLHNLAKLGDEPYVRFVMSLNF